jgi:hypothetical protein
MVLFRARRFRQLMSVFFLVLTSSPRACLLRSSPHSRTSVWIFYTHFPPQVSYFVLSFLLAVIMLICAFKQLMEPRTLHIHQGTYSFAFAFTNPCSRSCTNQNAKILDNLGFGCFQLYLILICSLSCRIYSRMRVHLTVCVCGVGPVDLFCSDVCVSRVRARTQSWRTSSALNTCLRCNSCRRLRTLRARGMAQQIYEKSLPKIYVYGAGEMQTDYLKKKKICFVSSCLYHIILDHL